MKQKLLFAFFIIITLILAGYELSQNNKQTPSKHNPGITISGDTREQEINIDKNGYILSGENKIFINQGVSSGEIITISGYQYSFFNNSFSILSEITPKQWEYHYNNLPIEFEKVILTGFGGIEKGHILVTKTPYQEVNKCDLYKTNNTPVEGSYLENSKTQNGINIKTVFSQINFTIDGKSNKNWYGINCFSLGNMSYEIHVNNFNKAKTISILDSISLAK